MPASSGGERAWSDLLPMGQVTGATNLYIQNDADACQRWGAGTRGACRGLLCSFVHLLQKFCFVSRAKDTLR